ncbi:MAG: SDR family NAD(P)-dependent oxidoreductase [Flavobacteriales bacterium]|nr:SDR family NAD(P)-dependent oxidoreductase [Flavobacteriales bacterium]
MKTILITGGAGFIGSNLTDRLLKDGFKVVSIDNFDPFYDRKIKESNIKQARANPNFTLVEADIRDEEKMRAVFCEHMPYTVVHLAAKAGVRPSIESPKEYYDVNVMGTLNLLQIMQDLGLRRMVFASSSSVYGNNKKTPFSEDDSVDNPISPYAATKKAGELLCHTFHHLYGCDITCLRFFTVYGPRQRPDLAIHKFTDLILKGKPIPVFGDGSSARDYTFVSDIVDGIVKSMDKLSGYHVLNLGESTTITLAELISSLEEIIGRKAIINRMDKQLGDVDITFADISKAKRILSYAPKYSKEEGLSEFVAWKINTQKSY